jgi:predicted anti-sigma-YlaC factor YlaD
MRHLSLALAFLALGFVIAGCSLKRMAVNSVANSIASGGDVFSRDDDPELIRAAIPFGLKTMESLLEVVPDNRNLLLAACQGYTQYAYAFVQLDADLIEPTSYEEATRLRDRALKLFVRGRNFGLRALELKHKGITRMLQSRPDSAARLLGAKEVPMIFWTAAAWGSAINLGKDRPDLAADIDAVKALITRGLALNERFDRGAFHEAMIVMESLPPAMGGSPQRARQHFERAVALSEGSRPGPFVTLAQSVSVASQNRREFRELLGKALEVDPEKHPSDRLETLVIQRKARALLAREDELFLDPDSSTVEKSK